MKNYTKKSKLFHEQSWDENMEVWVNNKAMELAWNALSVSDKNKFLKLAKQANEKRLTDIAKEVIDDMEKHYK